MKRILILTAALLMLVALASCARKSDEGGTTSSAGETPAATPGTSGDLATATPSTSGDTAATQPKAAAPVATPASAVAGLDDGPRAVSEPVDAALATKGAALFKSKGCVTCHGFGKRVIGPDLAGVSKRRTSRWMESQILHPEKMIVQDPIAKALFAQYKIPMTNQNLTADQAKAVVEYIKQTDRGGK